MAKRERLPDVYRVPGFIAYPTVRGRFGDPLAVAVSPRRTRENHPRDPRSPRSDYGKGLRRVRGLACSDKRAYLEFHVRRAACLRHDGV
jgi:hypothetical protein